jgi:chromosome segregation ATPase
MLGSDNEAGIFGVLFGIVMLVLFTVAIGVLANKRMGFSSRKTDLVEEIGHQTEQIADLENRLEHLDQRFIDQRKKAESFGSNHARLQKEAQLNDDIIKEKRAIIPGLMAGIAKVESEIALYRKKYQLSVWNEAIGESLPRLETISGKVYDQVVIKKVTAHHLEITHKDGISRIGRTQLGPTWRERFQWVK